MNIALHRVFVTTFVGVFLFCGITVGHVHAAADLTGTITKVTLKEKNDGNKLKVKLTISNIGTETATGPFFVQLWLSEDARLSIEDEALDFSTIKQIKTGQSKTKKFKVRELDDVAGKFVIVSLDGGGAIIENNERNNILVQEIGKAKSSEEDGNAALDLTPLDVIPDFTIVPHADKGFTATNRKIIVFGVSIYALADVEDEKLLHAANVLAQYLDNNEDGIIDDPAVGTAILREKAAIFMWPGEEFRDEGFRDEDIESLMFAQDLGGDETKPAWHINGHTGQFDASLEEILHMIHNSGYGKVYPEIFNNNVDSALASSMDFARGGHFTTIPTPYPAGAWYTYDDETCSYGCMVDEYFYWGLTSILGAQANRLDEISQEWDLNTRELVQVTDPALFTLLTNPQYKLPTVLPDGTYRDFVPSE